MPVVSFSSLSLGSAVAACLGLAGSFVLSLYLANGGKPRDHPTTVRRRITAVTMVTVTSPLLLYLLGDHPSLPSLMETLGFKTSALLRAVILPLILIPILYAGPILQSITSVGGSVGNPLIGERRDIVLRNYVVAPIAEEVVFRSCMIPLLRPHLGDGWSVVLTPLFFGIAHLHHMIGKWRHDREPLLSALVGTLFQTAYTSIFGMFSAYLFVRTSHASSAILAHSLCNVLGLPDFWGLHGHKHRYVIGTVYVVGLCTFIYLLPILTNPDYYY